MSNTLGGRGEGGQLTGVKTVELERSNDQVLVISELLPIVISIHSIVNHLTPFWLSLNPFMVHIRG